VRRRASRLVLGGLLLLVCAACGGDDRGGESFAIYHLETAIGPPGAGGELRCGPPRPECPGVAAQPPPRLFRYEVKTAPALTGKHIDRSSVRRATDSDGAALLAVALTAEGRRAFARVTREAARIGGRDLGWHHIAVVVGDEIVAFPEVDFDVYPDGIPDAPGIQIAVASDADADDLLERLRG
jgi:SecD-like export protein